MPQVPGHQSVAQGAHQSLPHQREGWSESVFLRTRPGSYPLPVPLPLMRERPSRFSQSGFTMPPARTQPVLSPEEIATRSGREVPFLRLPERGSLFAERALRLRRLAAGHAMRDYLMFVAMVAEAQHEVLQALGPLAVPDRQELLDAARQGVPPLPAVGGPRDPAWRTVLRDLLARLRRRLAPGPAVQAIDGLAAAADPHLEQQADRLLAGVMPGLDLATAPLVGAALQVVWVQLVAQVQHDHGHDPAACFGRIDDAAACPCCGMRPAAGITRLGADVSGQRYLHCSLCAAEWQRPRITCARCGNTEGLYYHALQPRAGETAAPTAAPSGTVQAECCDACGHYLKIVHMEKDPQADPVADDLATVTLDLLVAEAGLQRHGVNLMLLFGDPEASRRQGDDAS
jgi:FdhE protein